MRILSFAPKSRTLPYLLGCSLCGPVSSLGCSSEDRPASTTSPDAGGLADSGGADVFPDSTADAVEDGVADAPSDGVGQDTEPLMEAGSDGWHLTVYFTAVESFFTGQPVAVTGCLNVDCSDADDPDNALGDFPPGFVNTVCDEGTGLIEFGAYAGHYLNWSASQPGSGYWLDTAPRNAQGTALVPWVSAASHPSYDYGAHFAVTDCGVDETTSEVMDTNACEDLRNAQWIIEDRFEDDDEVRHLDLYIGLQTQADMNDDPHFVDQVGASTTLP